MRLRHGRQDWSHWPLLSCMELQRFGSRKWQCCPFAFNLLNQTPNPKPNKNRQRQLQPSQLVVCGVQLVCFQRSQRKFDSLAPGFGWFYLGVLKIGGSPRKTHTHTKTNKTKPERVALVSLQFQVVKTQDPTSFWKRSLQREFPSNKSSTEAPKTRATGSGTEPLRDTLVARSHRSRGPNGSRLVSMQNEHEFQKTQTQQPMLQLISPGLTPRCLGLCATTRLMAYALRKSVWAVSWFEVLQPKPKT